MEDQNKRLTVELPPNAGLYLEKKADDPTGVCRISLGGLGGELPEDIYCVYRGSKEKVVQILAAAMRVLGNLEEEPEVSTDTPGKFPS